MLVFNLHNLANFNLCKLRLRKLLHKTNCAKNVGNCADKNSRRFRLVKTPNFFVNFM